MAKLVNKPQPIRVGVRNPGAVYSRWLVTHRAFSNVAGSYQSAITPPVGVSVWLLQVSIRYWVRDATNFGQLFMDVMTGSGSPGSAPEMADAWDRVLPCYGTYPNLFGEGNSFEWDFEMRRLFTGEARRFGFWGQNLIAFTAFLQVGFLISEG
ncbi:hypothetical protein ES703_99033 [subsurface metagenome]